MEAASEKRRGRGRPPKFPEEWYRYAEAEGPKTRRGQQDHIYARYAIDLLRERYPEGTWLTEGIRPKWTLLAELGRVATQHGQDSFWLATAWILENKPPVKDGIRAIRRNRTSQS